MSYRVRLRNTAEKELNKLPMPIKRHVAQEMLKLVEDPRPQGIKALKPPLCGYRIRVGDWRVLYTVDDQTQEILVYAIRHRREVYRPR